MDQTLPHGAQGPPVRCVKLEVVEGPDAGLSAQALERVSVGTARANDLVLTDAAVSRHHLEVSRSGDMLRVQDHGSTNGTSYRAARVQTIELPPGERITLGKSVLLLSDGDTVALESKSGHRLGGLFGSSPSMRQLMAQIERAAPSDASVLLLGETGTGKEIVAQTIHECSARAEGPFEAVDCGAVLPTLIGSELFGHERGAFTGADRQHIGAFERADGGTLFLDEIGEMPANLQTTLLGALERRSFRRLGGTSVVRVNVRVVAATNRDLRREINAGSFRSDLYYRLAVVLLRVPALRERAEDIPLLVSRFLELAQYRGHVERVIPRATMESFMKHRWPGNVRELRNAVEAAMVMGEAQRFESEAAVEATAGGPKRTHTPLSIEDLLGKPYHEARAELVSQFEEIYVKHVLDQCDGHIGNAARAAGINRTYLGRVAKRRGLATRPSS